MQNYIFTIALLLGINCLQAQTNLLEVEAKAKSDYKKLSKHELDEMNLPEKEYVEFKKREFNENQKSYKAIATSKSISDLCDGGTFDQLLAVDWSFQSKDANGGNSTVLDNTGAFTPVATNADQVHHQIVARGLDPNVLSLFTTSNVGNNFSLRLGNMSTGNNSYESISKLITVTNVNSLFSFSYAMVCQDGGHTTDNPAFLVNILDATNTTINYNNLVNLGGGTNIVLANHPSLGSFGTGSNKVKFKNWTCVDVDLSSLIGRRVIIEFKNRDCLVPYGGHYSYTYLDNICLGCSEGPDGSVTLNLLQTDSCGAPGKICINYTVPSPPNSSIIITLNLTQNNNIIRTLTSPSFSSNGGYCFQLSPADIAALNSSIGGFDYHLIGTPRTGSFIHSPIRKGHPQTGFNPSKLDYKFACSSPTPSNNTCCPLLNNLIKNYNFSENLEFKSDYVKKDNRTIYPGEYHIGDDRIAKSICSDWKINDHSTCNNTIGSSVKNFLMVNGRTGIPNSKKIVWSQKVDLKKGDYKFCGWFKNLSQCCFDVKPKIDIIFKGIGSTNSDLLNKIIDAGNASCDWKSLEQYFTIQNDVSITLEILLDESGLGDGNDLAVDDIALYKLEPTSDPLVGLFNVAIVPQGGNFVGITSTSATPPSGCANFWEVCELDATTDQCKPNTTVTNGLINSTNFKGYVGSSTTVGTNPGKFDITKTYRITKKVGCNCNSASSKSIDVFEKNGKIQIYDPISKKVIQELKK